MKKRNAGFTVTELVVVIGIITILASLLWPTISSIRSRAKKVQCAGNLSLIHQALTMYSVDNSRFEEMYPTYVTNLFSVNLATAGANGSYVSDERVFICPMDDTKATQNTKGITALKPGNPKDDKSSWAERVKNGLGQRNCSYLYEFSGRISETYSPDDFGGTWTGSPSTFGDTYLMAADDSGFPGPNPSDVVRDPIDMGDGTFGVTWADMKFCQLAHGDVYITGYEDSSAGDFPDPPANFLSPDGSSGDPFDYYNYLSSSSDTFDPSTDIVTSYSRSWMPIVRCFWHVNVLHIDNEAFEEVQNVSLDGNVFNSGPYWERTAFKYGPKTGG